MLLKDQSTRSTTAVCPLDGDELAVIVDPFLVDSYIIAYSSGTFKAPGVSVEMSSIHTVLVFALLSAASFTPVCLLEFCQSTDSDCHSHDKTASDVRSRWSVTVSQLIQDLGRFSVSCKKLIEAFPVDEVGGNFVRTVKNCMFSRSIPTPLKGPLRLAAVSKVVL